MYFQSRIFTSRVCSIIHNLYVGWRRPYTDRCIKKIIFHITDAKFRSNRFTFCRNDDPNLGLKILQTIKVYTIYARNDETYEWLVLWPVGLHDDNRNTTVISGFDNESVVRRRVVEPRSNLARDLELMPGAGRARSQVYRPASDHLSYLCPTLDDGVDKQVRRPRRGRRTPNVHAECRLVDLVLDEI